jgi:predicted RNase H-like nuclease
VGPLLLVGADTVFRCGTVSNKAGTRALAEAAGEQGFVTEEGAYPAEEIRALVDRTPFFQDGYDLLRGS